MDSKRAAYTYRNSTNINRTTVEDPRCGGASAALTHRIITTMQDLTLRMLTARIDDKLEEHGTRAVLWADAAIHEEITGHHNSMAVEFQPCGPGLVVKTVPGTGNDHTDQPLPSGLPTARAVLQTREQIRFVVTDKNAVGTAMVSIYFEPYSDRALLRPEIEDPLSIQCFRDGDIHPIKKEKPLDHYKLPVGNYRINVRGATIWLRVLARELPQCWETLPASGTDEIEESNVKKGKRRADDLGIRPISALVPQRQRRDGQQDVSDALSTQLELLELRDGVTLRMPRSGDEMPYEITRLGDLAALPLGSLFDLVG